MAVLKDIFSSFLRGDTGAFGEALTELELNWAKLFGKKGITLRNLYIPKENGETSEIDLVYITQKGIFVIESKNYSGWIFGDERGQYWTQSLPNKQKNRFYNPVKQNRTHIKWLKEYLGEDIFCYSAIVFSNRCELKKVDVKSEHLCVIKREELSGVLIYLWKHLEDSLNEAQIELITEKLKLLTNADEAVKQAHIEDINRKFRPEAAAPQIEDVQTQPAETPETAAVTPEPTAEASETTAATPEATAEPPETSQNPVCPRCGAELILRTAKKGANAGNQFYGCSAFPKCRYIKNIE